MMSLPDYVEPQGWALLERHGLAGFEALWDLQAEWFEPPNQRRGGWSGVARLELPGPDGSGEAIFLKRQENHTRRSLRHPLGEPTFAAEIRNILAARDAGVPTLEPVYFGQRGKRAILVTRELRGFASLDQHMREWRGRGWARSNEQRRALIPEVAGAVRRLHAARLVHNALHPKHVFVRFPGSGSPQVRLIDMEKMRRTLLPGMAARRDLDSLNRRSPWWGRTDRLRFLHAYFGVPRLTAGQRRYWHWLAGRYAEFREGRPV
jgi:hypothetical protein